MLRFESPLVEGRFVRRYKRFFADFELASGELVTAHCANPGSMKTCLVEGSKCWLTVSDNPKRKLRYTWQVVEVFGERVFVNPMLANAVVVEGIRQGVVLEFADYSLVRREVRLGDHSRIDLVLEGPAPRCFVEVKNATMAMGERACAFPDSVTARGTKHLHELIRLKAAGERAVMFFCVSREHALSVEPADEIDPEYGRALRDAIAAGVEILAYSVAISEVGVRLARRVSLRLPEPGPVTDISNAKKSS